MKQFEEKMALLRTRFVARAQTEVAELREAHRQGDMTTMRRIAHSLAGNAGLFGWPEFGAHARELESVLEQAAANEEILPKLEALIAEMPH
ncbi:MAG: Hpt domain-containing protein [Porphyrobacter sp.]|nr:Hpt domain-containing protein [Porphyrobacter sp.]